MEHLPQIIFDLALLLTVAGVATIVCKRFNQPLILGYVLAGFLISPAIGFLPDIGDIESIQTWSDIGVIFLMFGLGLEFSVVKLTTVGKPAIITAVTEMVLMIAAGILCGFVLGWSFYTCLFLGGMLAISSTTIIIKAFDELGLKGKKFTELVFGSLVIEDIIGIFLMVLLSTIAVGTAFDGGEIVLKLGSMALYLILWFVLSIILVPTLLKKVSAMLNDEVMLIVSIALCLIMVVLANTIGFSTALGAFIAGSILAGTVQAHRIEELFKPLKDFFGAIFFVSVGMMVSPDMIVEHIVPILFITMVTLIGKPVFTALGALLSGKSLKTSLQTGLSLSQIGEFSFIIAGLGVSLGVTADFLYPVIVAVSVITTLTTPFFIKSSDKVYAVVNRVLPESYKDRIEKRSRKGDEVKETSLWASHIKQWAVKLLMMIVAAVAVAELLRMVAKRLLLMVLPLTAVNIILTGVALVITGAFMANLFHNEKGSSFTQLWVGNRKSHLPLIMLAVINVVVSCVMVVYLIYTLEGIDSLWTIIPALVITLILSRSKWLYSSFLRFETQFVGNLNEKILEERLHDRNEKDRLHWAEDQLVITQVPATGLERSGNGRRRGQWFSSDLFFGHAFNLDLLAITRDGQPVGEYAIPHLGRDQLRDRLSDEDDAMVIEEGDMLTFLGTEEEIDAFLNNMVKVGALEEDDTFTQPLREYLKSENACSRDLVSFVIEVDSSSELRGKSIKSCGLKQDMGCLVLGIERHALPLLRPDRNMQFAQGDYVWLLGDSQAASQFDRIESMASEPPTLLEPATA